MLVEFRVKNYRSLRDEQVLSLVATKDASLQETNTIETGIDAAPTLLRSAVIYGPNAGGKSNLIKALHFMKSMVTDSATKVQPGQLLNLQPFLLDDTIKLQPTEFEITFILEKVRYQYGFALTEKRVVSEHLLVYKAFKPQRWFKRNVNSETEKDEYEFGASLKGMKNIWEGVTRNNSLFLSTAVQFNSEQLRPVFDWFSNKLVIVNEISKFLPEPTIRLIRDAEGKNALRDFLSAADLSIADIDLITRKVPRQSVHIDPLAGKTEMRNEVIEENELQFHHVTENGKAVFGLRDESTGTRDYFFLSGPVIEILKKGMILIVDELDNSLHTLLVRRLVQLFQHTEQNKFGAQLIFTAHDVSLLSADDLFRRDQFWFIEKDRFQASKLYALAEFSPRKTEALERGYLMGRYGAVPFLEPVVSE